MDCLFVINLIPGVGRETRRKGRLQQDRIQRELIEAMPHAAHLLSATDGIVQLVQ